MKRRKLRVLKRLEGDEYWLKQIKIHENEMIENTPPRKIQCLMQSLKELELEEKNKEESIKKLLNFITALCMDPEIPKTQIAESCIFWKMHFENRIPNHLYL